MSKIILLGYMGSGKSTIAKSLSKIQQLPFVDLDNYIEEKAKMSIKSIFETKGEIYFRKIEHQYFVELLNSDENLIIGLGGGTPCYANNHELLKGEGRTSIYLKASIDTLYNRLVIGKAQRPLIADKSAEEMREFIAIHLFERSYFYNQAQHTISVDQSVEKVVADIQKLINQ
ncbi:shikimate kinase [Flavobacterium algicola]|uniref:shikimate kinase n=1 Tax=Flavobacterium algicola TaxID=556529 RepID=UPI001EFE524C|nr:shikimate kinase [Flavobacterium algicola]MCG9792791.1 shikimate kinase [Flavobacterium algicola]